MRLSNIHLDTARPPLREGFGKRDLKKLTAPYHIAAWPSQYKKMTGRWRRKAPGYPSGRLVGGTQNKVDNGTLMKAVIHHERTMGGKRWPELEQAFLARAITYQGRGGDFIRPRTSIMRYLGNLKEPWPEGETMAQKMLDNNRGHGWQSARMTTKNTIAYLLRSKPESEVAERLNRIGSDEEFSRIVSVAQALRGGKRWPDVEAKILKDIGRDDPIRYLSYSKSLTEPWPEGEKLWQATIDAVIDNPTINLGNESFLGLPEVQKAILDKTESLYDLIKIAYTASYTKTGKKFAQQIMGREDVWEYAIENYTAPYVKRWLHDMPELADAIYARHFSEMDWRPNESLPEDFYA